MPTSKVQNFKLGHYQKILDSSLAEDRRLRHFFIDLLLLADQDGNVVITKKKIADRTGATLAEVEWGLEELMKPEEGSHTLENQGRRIEALDGHGYGWKILNYGYYRDLKSSKELREATRERVRKFREKKKAERPVKQGRPLKGERAYLDALERGDDERTLNRIVETSLPEDSNSGL